MAFVVWRCALRCWRRLVSIADIIRKELRRDLGSDVFLYIRNRLCRVGGSGSVLKPIEVRRGYALDDQG